MEISGRRRVVAVLNVKIIVHPENHDLIFYSVQIHGDYSWFIRNYTTLKIWIHLIQLIYWVSGRFSEKQLWAKSSAKLSTVTVPVSREWASLTVRVPSIQEKRKLVTFSRLSQKLTENPLSESELIWRRRLREISNSSYSILVCTEQNLEHELFFGSDKTHWSTFKM